MTNTRFQRIKALKPKPDWDKAFIGKTLIMMCGTPVKIERIVGSYVKQSRFEVNGAYHIVALDAYRQINKDQSITPEMVKDFDDMVSTIVLPKETGPIATRSVNYGPTEETRDGDELPSDNLAYISGRLDEPGPG